MDNLAAFLKARFNEERWTAEAEAKRQLVDVILGYEAKIDGEWGCCHTAEEIRSGRCPERPVDGIKGLRLIAMPYAGHEDYRSEWLP